MLQCMQTCACYVGSGRTAIARKGGTSARVEKEGESEGRDQRFYAMKNVLRSAHLVPTKSRTEVEDGSRVVFYVNN